MFFVETRVRWSDLDANRHMANASYMNFTSFARMEYLKTLDCSLENLMEHNVGPAVLREEFSFFKEAREGQDIIITTEQTGISENGEMFEFTHNLYNKENGEHLAYSKLLGVWFSMDNRKITPPPPFMVDNLKKAVDFDSIRKLSLTDLKSLPVKPKNIDMNGVLGFK